NQQFIARQRQDPALEKEPTPATKAKCNTFDLGKRGPSVEDLQLSRLSYLDYSRQRVDPDTSVVNDADPAALVQDADLRGRIVQFAFRADATPDHPSDKHRCDAVCPSQGWVIDGVSLRKNLQSAFDVKVIDAQIAADYDWVGLGVGPGTHVKLHLDVANVGLFPVNNTGTVTVRLKDLDGGKEEPPLVLPLPSSFSLQPGDVGPLEVPLDIPALSTSDAGSRMAILASVRLGGFPEAQRDNNGGDNCALFRQPDAAAPLNDWSPVCDLTAGPAVLLRAVHDLRARYTVTPLVDRVDGPRTQNVTIENVGNVVVEDAVLTLLQQQICPSGGATCPGAEEESWRIATSPPPGATWGMDSPAFAFTPGAGTTHPAPPAVLALGATGRFLLVAQVASAPGKSDHRFGNLVSLVAESLDNLYSDDFGGSQAAAPTPSCTASGGPATCAPGWSLDPAANFNDGRDPNNQDGAAGAWRLGDAQRGVLPGDADATLTFPPVDLTSINHAVFTFAHKEALEQGFDGARVEARLDGKGDWIPVVPKGGYPGTLQAANALNDAVPAQRDPGRTVAAFTGDTGPRALGTRGWVNSEFDLGQIPGLTAPVHLLTIDQGHAQPYTALHQAGAGAEDSATTLGTGWCPDSVQKQPYGPLANYDCWQRENLAYDLPKADPAGLDGAGQGHRFWWVGSTQLHTGPVSTFTADLVLQVPPLPGLGFGDRYRLTFWAWRSGLADPVCTQASGDCLAVLGGQATLLAQDPATGWAKYEVVLARPGQSTPPPSTITFSYDDNHARQDTAFGTPDRGAVVDDVQTEVIHLDSGVEKPRGTVGHPTGSPAWDAPAVGRVTARLTVHDGDGRPGSATVSFKVGTIADAAIPTWTLAATLAGSTASFAPATTQTAAVARYRLDFGDGTAAAGLGAPPASLEHTYAAAGNYQPILTVVDTQGVGGTTSAAVAVGTGNPAPTLGLLSLTPDASRQTYTASLALGSGGSPLADYALEFGDGSRETHAVDANNPLPSQSGREYAGHAAPIVWRPVERVPAVADGWNAYAVTGATSAPDGNPQGTAWVFADPGRSSHPADQRDYPVNAAERLLTPFVPLTKVGGTHANLTFWERYDLPKSADTRTVYVQSLDPQLGGGEAPGPWRALHAVSQTNSAYQSTVDRTPDAFCPKASIRNGWCPISLPVDAYIGKRVRFAFEMRTGPLQPALTAPPHPQRNVDAALGFFWMVTEVGIQADTLVGRPVQLRVHAATDASLHEGSLLVDNPRIVGSPYTDNVAVLLDSPGDLRGQPGAVLHLNGTVRNLAPHAAKEPVALQIRVVAANPLDALPPVGVSLVAAPHAMQAETILTGGVKSASVPLGVGQVDRVRFLADLQLPRKDECSKCLYRVEVRLLGAGSSYTDENLGDHQRDMLLAVEANTELTVAGGAIDPPTAELRPGGSEPLTISARLDYSKGTIVLKGLTAHVTASLYDDNGAQDGPTLTLPDMQVAGALLPAPGASATVPLGTWRAPQKGFYVFNVTLEKELPDGTRVAGTSQVGLGQALVGGTPLYWTDDLEGDLAARGWTADSAPATLSPIGSNCANPSIGSVPPGAQSAWHPTTWTAFDGA
ncbi:MAG: large repetitive protein, partial [Thermoplasmata archaeon]|nr:large repetitive protein [Thermoplasmata archaeon]